MTAVTNDGLAARLYIWAGMRPDLTEEQLGEALQLFGRNTQATAALLRGWATRPQPTTLPPIWHRLIGQTRILVGVS